MGGGSIEAFGPRRIRLTTAAAAFVVAASLAIAPAAAGGDRAGLLWLLAAAGLIAAVAALAGLTSATWWALVAFGVEYTVLRIGRGPVDVRAVYVAIGLFVFAELTMWSLDARSPVLEEADSVRRCLVALGLMSLITLFLGSLIVAVARLGRSTGVALTVVGVGATVAIMLVIARIAWRRAGAS